MYWAEVNNFIGWLCEVEYTGTSLPLYTVIMKKGAELDKWEGTGVGVDIKAITERAKRIFRLPVYPYNLYEYNKDKLTPIRYVKDEIDQLLKQGSKLSWQDPTQDSLPLQDYTGWLIKALPKDILVWVWVYCLIKEDKIEDGIRKLIGWWYDTEEEVLRKSEEHVPNIKAWFSRLDKIIPIRYIGIEKQAAPESYTSGSDVDTQKFRNLNDWHWEDKSLPFLKDEYDVGEDTQEYKQKPKVFREIDKPPDQAYDGIVASQKLSWQIVENLTGWLVKCIHKGKPEQITFGVVINDRRDPDYGFFNLRGWFSTLFKDYPEDTEESTIKEVIQKFKNGDAPGSLNSSRYEIIPMRKVIDMDKLANLNKLSWQYDISEKDRDKRYKPLISISFEQLKKILPLFDNLSKEEFRNPGVYIIQGYKKDLIFEIIRDTLNIGADIYVSDVSFYNEFRELTKNLNSKEEEVNVLIKLLKGNQKLSWQPYPLEKMLASKVGDIWEVQDLTEKKTYYYIVQRNLKEGVNWQKEKGIKFLGQGAYELKDVLDFYIYSRHYLLEFFIPFQDRIPTYLGNVKDFIKTSSELPKAEEIVQYDINPLTEMNLYPSKRKDNYDYKKRNTKGDEEMLFEKGLHQSVDRPETNRELTPYAKLSWQEIKNITFKDALNEVGEHVKSSGNFSKVRLLADNFPNEVNSKDFEEVHNKLLVPLSNRGVVKRRVSISQYIWMMFLLYRQLKPVEFFTDWINKGVIEVYRGSSNPPPKELQKGQFLSFTLSSNYALRFLQPDWVHGGWRDFESTIEGYLITTTVPIKNIHIFNDAQGEQEVVIKGPIIFNNIEKVKVKGREKLSWQEFTKRLLNSKEGDIWKKKEHDPFYGDDFLIVIKAEETAESLEFNAILITCYTGDTLDEVKDYFAKQIYKQQIYLYEHDVDQYTYIGNIYE